MKGGIILKDRQAEITVFTLGSVFNRCTKKSRTDALLQKIDQFVDFKELESLYESMYKASKRGKPLLPIIGALKCLIVLPYS